jgi:YidC/Oxa1 family membrane protein insertase
MSQNPNPRGNLIQFMLIMCVAFLGLQLLFPPRQPDPRSANEIWDQMVKMNAEGRDVDIAAIQAQYIAKLNQDKAAKTITEDEFRAAELRAQVLVADTQLKSGIYREKDPNKKALVHMKLDRAYLGLQSKYPAYHTTPLWNEPVAVAPLGDRLPGTETTAGQLYDTIVKELSAINRDQLVFGLFPGWPFIDALVKATGSVPGFSYWFAAFLLAVVVRIAVYPLAMRQFRWGKQMQQLQPYVKEVQEKFKDKRTGQVPPDKQAEVSAEVMKLYREYGINPLAGCGPALVQIPFFLAIFQCMQFYRFEFTAGTFLWIQPGATKFLGLQLAPNLAQVDQLLVIFYGISMVVSQMLMPVSDPTQVKQQRIIGFVMSLVITVGMFFYPVPSAFTLYWVFANVLATVHALYAYRQPAPPLQKVATVKGGQLPKKGRFIEMLEENMKQAQQNGTPKSNGTVDPAFFGKTGSPRKGKKGK